LHETNGSMASATDVAELRVSLRAQEQDIDCVYEGRTAAGRRVYRYRLVTRPALVLEGE
jgi:hypothetical protein